MPIESKHNHSSNLIHTFMIIYNLDFLEKKNEIWLVDNKRILYTLIKTEWFHLQSDKQVALSVTTVTYN